MMHIMFMLCDAFFTATQRHEKVILPNAEYRQVPCSDIWDVTCINNQTGEQHRGEMTTEQVQAIACLAIAGDDAKYLIPERAYVIVRKAFVGWPKEVQPIP